MQGNVIAGGLTISRQPGFDEAAGAIFGTVQKADEALQGIEAALCAQPVTAVSVLVHQGSAAIYAIKTIGAPHWPCVVVYYTFDATRVYLEEINLGMEPE